MIRILFKKPFIDIYLIRIIFISSLFTSNRAAISGIINIDRADKEQHIYFKTNYHILELTYIFYKKVRISFKLNKNIFMQLM